MSSLLKQICYFNLHPTIVVWQACMVAVLYLCPPVHIGMVGVHQLSHKGNATTISSKVHSIQAFL